MQYLIDFKDNVSEEEVNDFIREHNLTLIKKYPNLGMLYIVDSAVMPPTSDIIEEVVTNGDSPISLLNDVTVELIQGEDGKEITINKDDEDEVNKNWWKLASLAELDFNSSSETFFKSGKHSTVYIMDSGIDLTHPEFNKSKIELLHSFNGDFTDTNGHGTSIASLLVGDTIGMTQGVAKIVKIFHNGEKITINGMIDALEAIVTDYYANERRTSVVNMSWSIPFNSIINRKIDHIHRLGITVVAAAGNSGHAIADITPACIQEIITVGSYNQELEPCDFSNFTNNSEISLTSDSVNYGALDLWAPGENIYTALPGGGYGYVSGTSISAAIASSAFMYNMDEILVSPTLSVHGDTERMINFQQQSYIRFKPRFDLLDLSDPKYNKSQNVIVSFMTNSYGATLNASVVGYENTRKYQKILSPNDVSQIVIHDAPNELTVTENGIFIIDIPNTNSEVYEKTIEFTYTAHMRNGEDPVSGIIKVYSINNDTEYSEEELQQIYQQLGSEELDVLLLEYTWRYIDPFQCGPPGCSTIACGVGCFPQSPGTPKSGFCVCLD